MSLSLSLSLPLSLYLSLSFFWVMSCLLITLNKCLKGHKSLGSLLSLVKTLIVSLVRQTNQGTRSPIELFWTAKKSNMIFVSPNVVFTQWRSGGVKQLFADRSWSCGQYIGIFSPHIGCFVVTSYVLERGRLADMEIRKE